MLCIYYILYIQFFLFYSYNFYVCLLYFIVYYCKLLVYLFIIYGLVLADSLLHFLLLLHPNVPVVGLVQDYLILSYLILSYLIFA